MKVSQLIEKLQFAQEKFGDVNVKLLEEVKMLQEAYEDEVYVGVNDNNVVIATAKVIDVEDNYNTRFNRIMQMIDKWAEKNAGWDCREDAVYEVEFMLYSDEYKNKSDEEIAQEGILAWQNAE